MLAWHRGGVRTHSPIYVYVYVYVLTNASMPGLVKVGWTKDLEARVRKLSSVTGVPTPFVVAWACQAASPTIEALAHERLAWCRVSGRREFFRCDVAAAVRAIETCNVPLGSRYKPQRRPERAGRGNRPLSSLQMLHGVPRAVCGAFLHHPAAFCLVVGVLVAVSRPEIPAWVPRGAVVRAAIALEHLR